MSGAAGGGPGPREERGTAESSQLHPPHVDVNATGKPAQESSQSPTDVPTLPANASGRDTAPSGEQPKTIDDESMYDRRPEEDKDHSAG
ncbi:MAG TPA: hypothetical protein VEX86_08400 [Longimicrobium sp.]|nr:hypothetical protein [Longimicrobium sp.]